MKTKMGYDAETRRYTLEESGLHAGDGVTVVEDVGSRVETRIEYDQARQRWFVVGYEGQYPEDLYYWL